MQATIYLTDQKQEEPQSQEEIVTPGKPASTALAPLAEPVIEGEVTAIIEPEQSPAPKQRPYYVLPLFTLLVCLLIVGISLLVPVLTPSATVILIPRQEHISTLTTVTIHGRLLPALTLSQSTTVPATGHRHQEATKATGEITLYNGQFSEVTIAAGTILTGADGVAVITDQAAVIPAGNPPVYGQTTVSAHAIEAGEQGNIAAFDVDTVCCATSVLAKNSTDFTGGADARAYIVVTHHDIDRGEATIQTTLDKSESAALAAEVNPGEALVTPLCSQNVTSDRKIGEEAKAVTVIVSDTCRSIAYPAHDLRLFAMQMLTKQAMQRLGTGYRLAGNVQVSILHANITDQAQGIATIVVKLDAIYVYQIDPGERKHLVQLIAGKPKDQAVRTILRLPGIQGAAINSNADTLPQDSGKIIIVVVNLTAREFSAFG